MLSLCKYETDMMQIFQGNIAGFGAGFNNFLGITMQVLDRKICSMMHGWFYGKIYAACNKDKAYLWIA